MRMLAITVMLLVFGTGFFILSYHHVLVLVISFETFFGITTPSFMTCRTLTARIYSNRCDPRDRTPELS